MGSYSAEGKPNLMNAAWGGICCSEPPCVAVSLREATLTCHNILHTHAFSVGIPSRAHVEIADYVGIVSGRPGTSLRRAGGVRARAVDWMSWRSQPAFSTRTQPSRALTLASWRAGEARASARRPGMRRAKRGRPERCVGRTTRVRWYVAALRNRRSTLGCRRWSGSRTCPSCAERCGSLPGTKSKCVRGQSGRAKYS
ncbi:MAG: flavin reductase [Polyangiaceae bacterium]|nr:flavin reductase [Polyangiaceae bacterium]